MALKTPIQFFSSNAPDPEQEHQHHPYNPGDHVAQRTGFDTHRSARNH